MSPIWVAIPTGPWTGGASVGRLTIDSARVPSPPTIRPERVDRALRADLDRLADAVVERVGQDRGLRSLDAERAVLGVDLARRPERDRDLLDRPIGRLDPERDGLAGVRPEAVQRRQPVEGHVRLAVDRDDRVAGDDPGRLGRRAGLDATDLDAHRRVAVQGDAGEDGERERRRSSRRRRPG